MINRNWPFPIGETNRVLSILHYENYKCDWLCLVSSDTWSNILHSGRKGTKRFGICSDFLKKNRKNFSSIYLSLIYIHAFSVAAIYPGTPAEPPGRGTICKTGTTICNLSISHAPYPHYLCHRTPRGVHDMQDKKRKLDSVAGSTERFYAGPAREKFRQKSVFFPDRCSSK